MPNLRLYRRSTVVNKCNLEDIDRVHAEQLKTGIKWLESSSWKVSVQEKALSNSPQIIFIKNIETLEFLMEMNVVVDSEIVLPEFFELFEVGFAFEAFYKNVQLNGFLACLSDMQSFTNWSRDYINYLGARITLQNSQGVSSEKFVSVSVGSKKGTQYSMFSKEALKGLLTINMNDFGASVKRLYQNMPKRQGDVELAEDTQQANVLMARIVINMAIFNSVTGNEYLSEGLPEELEQNTLVKKNILSQSQNNFYVLDVPKNENNRACKNSNKRSHLRRAHYRNLRDERYYRNNNSEFGSRWIQVRPTFVKGTSYVQSSNV